MSDRYRKPYGSLTETVLRQNGFAGTTNKEVFLDDPSGARRFWPVTVTQFLRVDALKADRDQLWAEAVARFQSGAAFYLHELDLIDAAKAEQADRQMGQRGVGCREDGRGRRVRAQGQLN